MLLLGNGSPTMILVEFAGTHEKLKKNRKIFQKIAFFSGLPSTVVVRIAKVPETIVHLSGELVPIVSTSTAL